MPLHLSQLHFFLTCNNPTPQPATQEKPSIPIVNETPEYFNLRPALEHEYGYTHAVKIGNDQQKFLKPYQFFKPCGSHQYVANKK